MSNLRRPTRRENRHSGGRRRERGLTETVYRTFHQRRASRPSTFAFLGYAARSATMSTGIASLNWIVTRWGRSS